MASTAEKDGRSGFYSAYNTVVESLCRSRPCSANIIAAKSDRYVRSRLHGLSEAEIRDLFSEHGPVNEVAVVMDRETNRPRGFAFVTMNTKEGMDNAIKNLDGKAWNGRPLTVNEARPREARPAYSGGGGGGGGRGGKGGGGGGGGRW